jgi:transcriptional regulator with XRE-family HTH domain
MSMETFGQWLKAQREGRGLTLRQVEDITNGRVSNPLLSQLENGHIKSPSVKMLHQISAALGLDFATVCERACIGEHPPEPQFCPTCGQITGQYAIFQRGAEQGEPAPGRHKSRSHSPADGAERVHPGNSGTSTSLPKDNQ